MAAERQPPEEKKPGIEIDLRRIPCRNASCPSRRSLEPDPQSGWARCRACGARYGRGDLFRPYAQVTGSLIVSSVVMLSYAWTHEAGTARWVVGGVGLVQWIVIARRLLYQSRTIKQLSAPCL